MGANVAEKAEGRPWRAAWTWLFWLGAALMLYVLSTGPVVMLSEKKALSPGLEQALEVFYAPLWWTLNKPPLAKVPFIGKALGLYYHFWAPKRFDKDGNLVIHFFKAG